MAINVVKTKIFPRRRDGQLNSLNIIYTGGSGGSGEATQSSALSNTVIAEISARESGDASLSTALSTEISGSVHISGGAPLTNSLGVFTGGSVNILSGTTGLTYNGSSLITDGDIVSPVYTSGFAGSGFIVDKESNGDYSATFDNLTVRKMMKLYELQISKISAVNGGLIISVANGKSIGISGTTTIWFDVNIVGGTPKSPIQFIADDWVRAQQWDNGVNYFLGQVDSVGTDYITVKNITGAIWDSMDLVQVGHPTNLDRQGIIYITSSDTNNPYIDILSGVTNGNFSGKQKARLGNLTGISDSSFGGALSGFGLWSDNIYLKGRVQISSSDVSGLGDLATEDSVAYGDVTGTKPPADATNGATWGTNLNSIPNYLGTPSSAGLYMDGNALGYYNSGWKSYIDKDGNFAFGNYAGGGAGISWNQSTSALSIRGEIVITNTIPNTSISGLGTLATANSVGWTDVSSKPTGAAALVTGTPTSSGLYMNGDYMGYWNNTTGSWTAYINSGGSCSFTGIAGFTTSVTDDLGYYRGLGIRNQDICEPFYEGDGGQLFINRIGYNYGNTKGRSLFIGDGVGHSVASFYGGGYGGDQEDVTCQFFGRVKWYSGVDGRFIPPTITVAQARARRDYGIGATTGEIVFVSNWGANGQFAGFINGDWWNFTMNSALGG